MNSLSIVLIQLISMPGRLFKPLQTTVAKTTSFGVVSYNLVFAAEIIFFRNLSFIARMNQQFWIMLLSMFELRTQHHTSHRQPPCNMRSFKPYIVACIGKTQACLLLFGTWSKIQVKNNDFYKNWSWQGFMYIVKSLNSERAKNYSYRIFHTMYLFEGNVIITYYPLLKIPT